jgi:amidase
MDPFTPAVELAAAVRSREVSPVELAELYLRRIDDLDGRLNAFCLRDDDRVLDWARRSADEMLRRPLEELGPFHGVPLPIKDLYAVEGWVSTYGSQAASRAPATESDHVVQRFLSAGFIPLGLTNTPELAVLSYTESRAHGATRNPWDTDRTPGGSSGGAGAAVASGMAPLAHASDTAGSIRIPASCCGLVGLKPHRNRVSNGVNEQEGFTTSGVLTRTVADTAAVLDVIGQPDPLSWHNVPRPASSWAEAAAGEPGHLRIGWTTEPEGGLAVDPACAEAVSVTVAALEDLGHHVRPTDLLSRIQADRFLAGFTAVWNTMSVGAPIDDWDGLEPLNAAMRSHARELDSVAYVEAVRDLQRVARQVLAMFVDDVDILVTPTMAVEPPPVGQVWEGTDADPLAAMFNCFPMAAFTSVWNMTGLPAASLPVHQAPSGLPVGVQLVGGPWREDLVLQVAAQLERGLPWASRRPPVS